MKGNMEKSMYHRIVKYALMAMMIGAILLYFGTEISLADSKKVLLTFDDGPNPLYTPQILSILDEHQIKAVFFVVGEAVEQHPEILRTMDEKGHIIGNHTFSHRAIDSISEERLIEEVYKTDEVILNLTGKTPAYFRPPTGAYGKEQAEILQALDKCVLMWDYGLEKRDKTDPQEMVDYLIKRIWYRQKVILLLHDGDPRNRHDRTPTVEALPMLIAQLQEKGYAFVDPGSEEGQGWMDGFSKTNPKIGQYQKYWGLQHWLKN